jgi:hypothetical protein
MLRRFAWPAAIAALLIALGAGFLVGRVTDSGSKTVTTAATGSLAKLEQRKASKIAGSIDASDVVKAFPPQVVRDGDVTAEKKGTPERSFLEWWQAFQFHDAGTVESLTSKETLDTIGPDNLTQLVDTISLPGVEVVGASESGDTATLDAGLLSFQPSTPGGPLPDKPTNSQPDTFLMKKEHGDWLFDQTEFLQLKLESLQK